MAKWRTYLGTAIAALTVAAGGAVASPAVAAPPGPSGDAQFIVGGERATQGEFPFMVRLTGTDGSVSWSCGGSLYSPTVVLTAAHCIDGANSRYTATLGVTNINSSSRITRQATGVYVSPDYNAARPRGADWALVRLASPVTTVATLPIVTSTQFDSGTFTVAGWGATSSGGRGSSDLLKANVPFISDSTCGSSAMYGNRLTADREICAGYAAGRIDSCQGDSGGPLFRRDANSAWIQVGIVSWGDGCAARNKPGVYTQISAFSSKIAAAATSTAW